MNTGRGTQRFTAAVRVAVRVCDYFVGFRVIKAKQNGRKNIYGDTSTRNMQTRREHRVRAAFTTTTSHAPTPDSAREQQNENSEDIFSPTFLLKHCLMTECRRGNFN